MDGEVSNFNKDFDVCEKGGLHPRALEDVRDMGLGTDVRDHYVEMVASVENGSSWATRVDSLNNPKFLRETEGVRDPLADHICRMKLF
ncbi:hypothetical protein V6N12_047123 [Hibiscus sabdariffa]|uniref:Uncharacterized protein n=1 Tax=Hibiscus sabdariffa TaxID=183260 RepID=A0ABR2AN84_9ROSI